MICAAPGSILSKRCDTSPTKNAPPREIERRRPEGDQIISRIMLGMSLNKRRRIVIGSGIILGITMGQTWLARLRLEPMIDLSP